MNIFSSIAEYDIFLEGDILRVKYPGISSSDVSNVI